MAIVNASGLHSLGGTALVADGDHYAMARLADGRITITWAQSESPLLAQYNSVVSAANTAHTSPVTFSVENAGLATNFTDLAGGSTGGFAYAFDFSSQINGAVDLSANAYLFSSSGSQLNSWPVLSASNSQVELFTSVGLLGNGNYLFTWTDSRATALSNMNLDIVGRIFTPGGTAVGAEFAIAGGADLQMQSDVTGLGDGRSVVVWAEGVATSAEGDVAHNGLSARFLSADGGLTTAKFAVDALTAGTPSAVEYADLQVATLGNGGFVVAWSERFAEEQGALGSESVRYQMFNAAGAKVGSEVLVATGTPRYAKLVDTANGGFAILWQENGLTAPRSVLRQFDMKGVEIGTKTYVDTLSGMKQVFDIEITGDGRAMLMGGVGSSLASSSLNTRLVDLGEERLLGSSGADKLYGKNGMNDVILGFDGNDFLYGLSGNDTIDPGLTGSDFLRGGAGNDTYVLGARASGVSILDTSGTDTIRSSVSRTLAAGSDIENIELTGTANANAIGNSRVNVLKGNSGNNLLEGGGGADTFFGGAGDDTYVVGTAAHVVKITDTGGNDTIVSNVSVELTDGLGNVVFPGLENITLTGAGVASATGNSGKNVLIGNAANSTLLGGGGGDVLDPGTGGTDYLSGGLGDDTYVLAARSDLNLALREYTGEGTDTVTSTISRTLPQTLYYFENLTLLGTANISGTGNWQNNVIIGNSGNNVLNGRGGLDVLTGGAGSDSFLFVTLVDIWRNRATITDFSVADDTMRLDNAVFTEFSTYLWGMTLRAEAFWSSTTGLAHDANDRIIYNTATGILTYDTNGNLAGGVLGDIAKLAPNLALTNADFMIV